MSVNVPAIVCHKYSAGRKNSFASQNASSVQENTAPLGWELARPVPYLNAAFS